MKKKRSVSSAAEPEAVPQAEVPGQFWAWVIAAGVALFAALAVYSPALRGEFLFDDIALPFRAVPDYAGWTALEAMKGVRPLTSLSYWLSFHIGGGTSLPFHLMSVLLHAASALLLGFILLRVMQLLGMPPRDRGWLAAIGAGMFLLHPAQTEAVAYITSHSETLSVFFYFAAVAVFLSRECPRISWLVAAGTLLCFVLAMLSKEHALTLPAVLVLLDVFVYRQPLTAVAREGWRLYALLAGGAVLGAGVVLNTLAGAKTAGFGMSDLQWWEYLLTQGRAIVLYLRLWLLPVGQNGDYLFPISRGFFEHGAIFYWIVVAAGVVAAIRYRRQAPLIALGFIVFLLVLSPTSSILPIQDAAVERRVYLASLGLVLASVGVLAQLRLSPTALRYGGIAILVVLSLATFQRSKVWASGNVFWADVLAKNPESWRANVAVGLQALEANRCPDAIRLFEAAKSGVAANFEAAWHLNYARALECVGRLDEAEQSYRDSLAVETTASALSQLGVHYGKRQQYNDALDVLNQAIAHSPRFPLAWSNRGNVHARLGNCTQAISDFEVALRLMPTNTTAQRGIAYCREQQASQPEGR